MLSIRRDPFPLEAARDLLGLVRAVTTLMRVAEDKAQLDGFIRKTFPKKGDQMLLALKTPKRVEPSVDTDAPDDDDE